MDIAEQAVIPGGRFNIGTTDRILAADGEYPPRQTRVKPFRIDLCAVTNDRFRRFIEDTSYLSDAERYGWSYVFFSLLGNPDTHPPLAGLEWWRKVGGARWDRPEGPASEVEGRGDHPVTHVSWRDATAFASWAGGRLPTEGEWEFAAAGGLPNARFPWGSREPDDEKFMPCNIWQGEFPHRNIARDGYHGTAPVKSFEPNGFGLFNMVGNTWEWTAERFRIRSVSAAAREANTAAKREMRYLLKGGSFLCHKSYCYRYRIAARTSNTQDSTLSNIGFRVCYDPC